MNKIYRTLVRGRLVQRSGLSVGGTTGPVGGPDLVCARDGRGRLCIPGTGLAGALIETAGRIFPELLTPQGEAEDVWDRVSGKRWLRREGKAPDREDRMRQSLWHFWPAHLAGGRIELRQGVGIRQATGTTAAEARALYDLETIPAGAPWQLFFEIDSLRGGSRVESAALFALWEWTQGRCWLGASAARGLGWMQLEDIEVLRLPATREAVEAWPDNSADHDTLWRGLAKLAGPGGRIAGAGEVRKLAEQLWNGRLPSDRFWYVQLEATIEAGLRLDGYGLDSLSVGGHAAGYLDPLTEGLLRPLGETEAGYGKEYKPDAPIVTSRRGDRPTHEPFVPGSGVRGPLRHAASSWARGAGGKLPDPNELPEGKVGGRHKLRVAALRRKESDASELPEGKGDGRHKQDDEKPHPVSELFGLVDQSSRLLVCDAYLTDRDYRQACLQHHAEDEFVGGVYGSGKFDRSAVLIGKFGIRLLLEAKDRQTLLRDLNSLLPALRLAELGHLGLGGGKWRGHGWPRWRFHQIEWTRAGDPTARYPLKTNVSLIDGVNLQLRPGLEKEQP